MKICSKIRLDPQFLKFILVGIVNTIFGYSVFALLIFLGVHYSLAVLLTTLAAILFNFKTIGVLVFNNKKNSLIFKFFLVYSIIYVLNVGALKIMFLYRVNPYLAQAMILPFLAIISFHLNKALVFK